MLSGKMTYLVAILVILYAIIARGYGANDWNTGSILITVAVVGMCLRADSHHV